MLNFIGIKLKRLALLAVLAAFASGAYAGLANYGVVIGKPGNHYLYTGGQWPHYHIKVDPAGQPEYDSALDLFSPIVAQMVQTAHREIVLRPRNAYLYNGIFSLADGYYALPHNTAAAATGGALDFARHPGILRDLADQQISWDQNPLIIGNTVPKYDQLLQGATKVYIFGAPYAAPDHGVHDVHANQGNLAGTSFAGANGIWQDGAVIIEYGTTDFDYGNCPPGGQICFPAMAPHRVMLMTRFQAQNDFTDEAGMGITSAAAPHIIGSALGGSGLVTFGPIFHHQAEFFLNAAGGDNPEVYIKSDSAPTLSDYGVRAINFVRAYSATGQMYVSVKPSSSNLSGLHSFYWDYRVDIAN